MYLHIPIHILIDLAVRYNIKPETFPAILLFLQGKTEAIPFLVDKDSDFTANNIKRFIKTKSGVYLGLPGCVEQLDRLAQQFKSSGEKERKVTIAAIKQNKIIVKPKRYNVSLFLLPRKY